MSEETRALLRRASTAALATELLKRGLRRASLAGVGPLNPAAARFVGEAFTLRTVPAREDLDRLDSLAEPDHPQRQAIETIAPGQVLVIDCRREASAAALGSILAERLKVRGAAAVVTDGGVRDAEEVVGLGFPVFCAGPAVPASLTLHHAVEFQTPIACGGVAVYPGDVLVGDGDGVVVIPRDLAAEVAAAAVEQERLERFLKRRVRQGSPVPGTYPPDEATLAAYRRWREAGEPDD